MKIKFAQIWKFLKDKYVYTITFVLALILVIGAWYIGEVGPFGGRCLVLVDGVHQYLPFFAEYQDKLKNLETLQYTMDVGLGNNFLSLWSYYLSSPFNLIILLCSKTHLPMALNLIISVKLILGALCFAYFLMHAGKKPVKNPGIIVFSLAYAFSSFVVGYYWNLMWLDAIFVFPIIILGMERLFTKKDSRMYIIALLYSFICNYYISFMICLFLVLWFFTFHFKSFKDFFFKGVRFALASLTSAALAAVVLVPAYKGIMTTASAEFGLPEWEFYGSFADTLRSHMFCSEVMTNQVDDAGTNLYCGIFTILLACLFFFMKDIRLEKKIKYGILLAFLVVSFNNHLFNYIWHGFHNQYGIPNRFAFLYIFVLILMAYEVYLKRKSIKIPMAVGAYLVSMLFVAYCYYEAENMYETKVYIVTGALLTLYIILIALYRELPKKKEIVQYVILFVAFVELAVNGLYGFKQDGSSDPEYYYGDTENFEKLIDRVEEEEDGLYRSDILQPRLVDEATWYNLKSVGIFGSTVRGELVDMMADLGFYTGANEYLYYGATPFTNALLGVKYVYTRDGDFVNVAMDEYDSEENITVYKNSYALPIAYMVKEEAGEYDTADNGPFTVQNEFCGALSGIEPIFTTIYDDLQMEVQGTNLQITKRDDYNADYTNANDSAKADVIYKIPRDMDLYVSCRGANVHKIALLIDGNEVGYDRYQGQIFHVGKMKAGQMVDIQFELNEGEDMSGDIYCYPMEFQEDQFLAAYDELLSHSMEVTKFSDAKIEGNVTASYDGIFMMAIPYDTGWSVYANGEKMDTYPVLEGLMGIDLPEGEYEIKMVYRCPGLLTGFLTTLIGIAGFAIFMWLEKMQREGLENPETDTMDLNPEALNQKTGRKAVFKKNTVWKQKKE